MGWNDRLPEDPYIPFESEEDRTAYEEWHHYLECQLDEAERAAGLSSSNINPADINPAQPTEEEREEMLQRFVERFCGKKAEAAPEGDLAPNPQSD